jgi:3-hydroxybutyryl-CoA dehydratase
MTTGLWWDEFEEGAAWRTGIRRVTQADVDAFSALSGDENRLHLDDEYARAAGFDGRIAQGVLGLAITTGLLNQLGLTRGTLVALLGTTWSFLKPLYPDTDVYADIELGSALQTSRADRGLVILAAALTDEDGMVYQRGEFTLLVRRRPVAAAAGGGGLRRGVMPAPGSARR